MRVAIIEDEQLYRALFRKICRQECGCSVVGEAGTGQEAKRIIRSTAPDLLLLDLRLSDGDGFDVIDYTRERFAAVRILIISAYCDEYAMSRLEKSGVHGFVDKNTQSIKTVAAAIQALKRGETYWSRSFLQARQVRARAREKYSNLLSERECTILALIGQSFSDEEIARQLGISRSTAQTHRSHILRKLDLPNSVKLAHFAQEHGFTSLSIQQSAKAVSP